MAWEKKGNFEGKRVWVGTHAERLIWDAEQALLSADEAEPMNPYDIGIEYDKGDEYLWFGHDQNGGWYQTKNSGLASVVAGSGDLTTDARGIQKFVQDFSLFHGIFTFDVPSGQWIIIEDGVEVLNSLSTRGTSVNGLLKVTSGPADGNSCFVESRRHPRYQPDRGAKWASSIGFKDASLDGELRAGFLVDNENGIYLNTVGDGKLYFNILNDGVLTHHEEITFPFDIDITKGNLYDIQVQWRGLGIQRVYADNPANGVTTLVHSINFLNTLDEEVLTRNPAMSVGFHAINGTEEVSFWSGCVDVTSEGGLRDREQYGEYSLEKLVASSTVPAGGIFALLNPPLAPNGKINTRDLNLARITLTADKKCTIKMYRTRDPTAITGGAFATFKSTSFVEANSTMSAVDKTKMEEFATFRLSAGITDKRDNPSKDTIDFFMIHGDYIVGVLESGVNVTVTAVTEWGEEV